MKPSHIILWIGFALITVQIIKDWGTIKTTLFQGGLNFGGTGSNANVFADIAGGDFPKPFGGPQGNAGQQIKQGETYWQRHGQANNCPPGFPPGDTCMGM